ncbi:MAG: hypothetical protein BJ554DRAFT_5496 [Olpidium bornovanus]|uniref:Uncharacterized protein n=1 Tax=Olpidium bornovanus TaxID=278681 RepID=A0A8H7ZZJ3_9FUNG|nr:MAG: hypothetical protein BJ554DRAFT_5496 [Olpidium bornovanus]
MQQPVLDLASRGGGTGNEWNNVQCGCVCPSSLLPVLTAFSVDGRGDALSPSGCPIPSHDALEIAVGLLLLLGMVVSYLPQVGGDQESLPVDALEKHSPQQHYRIIFTKSSEGFSPIFLLMGAVATNCGTLNIVLLQWGLFGCCRTAFTAGDCAASLLGVAQVGTQWVMFMGIQRPASTSPPLSEEWKTSVRITTALMVFLVFWGLLSFWTLWYYGSDSNGVARFAGLNGLMSMALGTVQFLPQIYWTWKAKVRALSIPMMLLQTPGSFLLAYTISIRPGTNWTSWITYLVGGTFQGMLLLLCITWHLRGAGTPRLSEDVDGGHGGDDRGLRFPVAEPDPARNLAAILTGSLAAVRDGAAAAAAEERRPLLGGNAGLRTGPAESRTERHLASPTHSTRQTRKRVRSPSPIPIVDDCGG